MGYRPTLEPCRDSQEGSRDWNRHEELGLPMAWIDWHRSRPGPWIAPDEYFWTPKNYFKVLDGISPAVIEEVRARTGGCFFDWPLQRQCDFIGAKYVPTHLANVVRGSVERVATGKSAIELQVLEFFAAQGWKGEPCEGSTFSAVQHLIACWFIDHGLDFGPTDPITHRPMNRQSLSSAEAAALVGAANSLNEGKIIEAVKTAVRLRSQPPPGYRLLSRQERQAGIRQKPFLVLPQGSSTLTMKHVTNGWQALGPSRSIQVCERKMLGFGTGGWPDITMYRDGITRFVEVKKAGDKFTPRQADWVRNIARPLGWEVEFLHVKVGRA